MRIDCKEVIKKVNDDDKTNKELLEEIRKLREENENQNKKTAQNSAQNTMIVIGILLLVICGGIFLFAKCFL